MKLDANALRYLSRDDWRVLTAVELGQKNHEIVPAPLIESIAKLKHGGVLQRLSTCLKHKLLHHDSSKYDGYRLTTLGYDFLAIHTLTMRGAITSVGRQIGVGKESDLFEVAAEDGTIMALKLHRLGRTSFRAVKSKRDYLRKGNHYSWLYLSRLAAIKEFSFMKALGKRGLPVPTAIEQNRHAVLMELVQGDQLAQVRELDDPGAVFEEMVQIMCDMVRVGLVHCDFNEFNVIISPTNTLTAIDFPQMVSISHANARALFERDLNCITRFFEKKMGYHVSPDVLPVWDDLVQQVVQGDSLDVELHASGFNHEDGDVINSRDGRQATLHDSRREDTEDSATEDISDDEEESVDGDSASQTSLSADGPGGPGDGCIEGLQIQEPGSSGPDAAAEPRKASSNAHLDTFTGMGAHTKPHTPDNCSTASDVHEDMPAREDAANEQGGRRPHGVASQQEALAQLHRKAKAHAKRQSQIKASRNVVKQKGRKKHARESLF